MGAPVYNTNYVGHGTRLPKPVLGCQQGGTWVDDAYTKYKHAEGQGKKLAEIGAGLYSGYQYGRAAYPYIRAGLAALTA